MVKKMNTTHTACRHWITCNCCTYWDISSQTYAWANCCAKNMFGRNNNPYRITLSWEKVLDSGCMRSVKGVKSALHKVEGVFRKKQQNPCLHFEGGKNNEIIKLYWFYLHTKYLFTIQIIWMKSAVNTSRQLVIERKPKFETISKSFISNWFCNDIFAASE